MQEKYTQEKLIDHKYIRTSASNVLSQRIDSMRDDLCKGGSLEESNISILARALAVTGANGLLVTARFKRD
jgi:hypothetical protein